MAEASKEGSPPVEKSQPAGAQPELARRGPLRAGAVDHHHRVAACGHADRDGQGREREHGAPNHRLVDTLGFSHRRLRMPARR